MNKINFLIKILIFICVIKFIKADLNFCDKENKECNTSDIMFSDSEATDVNSFVKQAIKYFNSINQNYDNKINAISSDIEHIKNRLLGKNIETNNCISSPQHSSDMEYTEKTTEKDNDDLYSNLWIIIQSRQDGSVNFHRNWYHYKKGFGNPFREFFIGLDKLHYLTNRGPHELLIQMETFNGTLKYARYDEFLVGDESEKYQLKKLGKYSGDAGDDYLRNHTGMYFSTKDRDNDASDKLHCSQLYKAGWWYNNCLTCNLNGPYRTRYDYRDVGLTWGKPDEMQLQVVQMLIRLKK